MTKAELTAKMQENKAWLPGKTVKLDFGDQGTILMDGKAEAVTEAYGVWVLKTLYGREYMGIERATFLIDAAGVVRRVWRQVRVKDHAETVLTAAKEL